MRNQYQADITDSPVKLSVHGTGRIVRGLSAGVRSHSAEREGEREREHTYTHAYSQSQISSTQHSRPLAAGKYVCLCARGAYICVSQSACVRSSIRIVLRRSHKLLNRHAWNWNKSDINSFDSAIFCRKWPTWFASGQKQNFYCPSYESKWAEGEGGYNIRLVD